MDEVVKFTQWNSFPPHSVKTYSQGIFKFQLLGTMNLSQSSNRLRSKLERLKGKFKIRKRKRIE